MDEGFIALWRDIRSSSAIPLWVMALAIVGGLVKVWPLIMERLNEARRDRHNERSNDWTRLRDEITRLDARLKAVEAENEDCRRNLAAVRDELAQERADRMKFERLLQGEGEIRQAKAEAAAVARQEQARKGKDDA